ncbi:hypothetical protein [Stakelama pacifica]|uniref:Uncharacterized protein n=1 Tax=Stakelama pacifica TaxID=517720 RepID=A0A4R6FKW1_9SPHN|nr:hypothetical protein [Stakelama pacifica]TDN81224.1 hypothetical protein EV664_108166 [Stakelama pacifica]
MKNGDIDLKEILSAFEKRQHALSCRLTFIRVFRALALLMVALYHATMNSSEVERARRRIVRPQDFTTHQTLGLRLL